MVLNRPPQEKIRWVPPDFVNIVRTFLDEQFPAKWIGRGSPYSTWTVRSADLTLLDFFPVGVLMDLADLKERTYAAINNVTPEMLRNTWVDVEYRLDISHATNGSHVEVYGTQGKKNPVFSLCRNLFNLPIRISS